MNNETKHLTFGSVMSWLVGVLFGILGLTNLPTNTAAGIFFLITAFITLPVGNKIIREKFKISLSKGLRIFLILILLTIGFALSSNSKVPSMSDSGSTQKTQASVEAIKVSAVKLSADYKANEVAADATYKGKIVEVSGTVETIGKDILDTPYVTLKTDTYSIVGIQCMFNKDSEKQLAILSKGQSITLQGEVSGKLMNVLITDCTIKE